MPNRVYTSCCTLNQMVASDEDSFKSLKKFVQSSQFESQYDHSDFRQGGAKALFCMTAPFEHILEKNLERLGFTHIYSINRRVGYKPGKVKMWILSW